MTTPTPTEPTVPGEGLTWEQLPWMPQYQAGAFFIWQRADGEWAATHRTEFIGVRPSLEAAQAFCQSLDDVLSGRDAGLRARVAELEGALRELSLAETAWKRQADSNPDYSDLTGEQVAVEVRYDRAWEVARDVLRGAS